MGKENKSEKKNRQQKPDEVNKEIERIRSSVEDLKRSIEEQDRMNETENSVDPLAEADSLTGTGKLEPKQMPENTESAEEAAKAEAAQPKEGTEQADVSEPEGETTEREKAEASDASESQAADGTPAGESGPEEAVSPESGQTESTSTGESTPAEAAPGESAQPEEGTAPAEAPQPEGTEQAPAEDAAQQPAGSETVISEAMLQGQGEAYEYDQEIHEEIVPEKGNKVLVAIGRVILGLATTAVVGAGCYYGYGAYYYATHFYDGSTVVMKSADGSKDLRSEDISGMTEDEVRSLVGTFCDDYDITIIGARDTEDELCSADIEYKITDTSTYNLVEAIGNQDYLLWITHMTDFGKAASEATYQVETTYNADVLDAKLDEMKCISPAKKDEGKDAYLTYNEDTHLYDIVEEEVGNLGDKELIAAKVIDALNTGSMEVELDTDDYLKPEVLSDDEKLVSKQEEINTYLGAEITVSDHGETIVVDGSVIYDFLIIDDDWNVTLDEGAIATYVNTNFDPAFDTMNTKRTFHLNDSGDVTLTKGSLGSIVKTADEVPTLVEEITNGEVLERKPCYYDTYEVEGNNGIGDSYVDVNISAQMVYVVIDGETVLSTPCVTGTDDGSKNTPTGVYYVWGKTTEFTMTTYNAFVHYWMPIDDTGVGLHDATWRSSFGGSIYKYSGSHGCINLPLDQAKKIYKLVYIGIPVVVHK